MSTLEQHLSYGTAYHLGRNVQTIGQLTTNRESGSGELARRDALPEFVDYRDIGCSLYSSCLSCPLPQCRFDVNGGEPAMVRQVRNGEIFAARSEGLTVNEIAARFGMSRRGIFHILHGAAS